MGGAVKVYGPREAPYNRHVHWVTTRVRTDVFHSLSATNGPPVKILINKTVMKRAVVNRAPIGG